MDPLEKKQALLHYLTRAFDAYLKGMHNHLACRPGCASCCTQNVTVTSLEARQVYAHLKQVDNLDIGQIRPADTARFHPTYTTNDFAAACFEHRDLPEEFPGPDVSPCPLLKDDHCSVYEARPFACRSFLSQEHCPRTGQAQIPSALASVIGACQQIIEHIDTGGQYGNLSDMLIRLDRRTSVETESNEEGIDETDMPPTKPLPGFMIPPEDRPEVNAFLSRLFSIKIDGIPFLEHCSSLRPMPFD